jgi:hypothetical protein
MFDGIMFSSPCHKNLLPSTWQYSRNFNMRCSRSRKQSVTYCTFSHHYSLLFVVSKQNKKVDMIHRDCALISISHNILLRVLYYLVVYVYVYVYSYINK